MRTATPKSAIKPTAGGNAERHTAEEQCQNSAGSREWHVQKDESGGTYSVEVQIQQDEDRHERKRNCDQKTAACAFELLELAAPFHRISFRQIDFAFNFDAGLRDKTSEIAASHVQFDADAALTIFPADLSRSFLFDDVSQLGNRYEVTIGIANLQIANCIDG